MTVSIEQQHSLVRRTYKCTSPLLAAGLSWAGVPEQVLPIQTTPALKVIFSTSKNGNFALANLHGDIGSMVLQQHHSQEETHLLKRK